MKVRTLILVFVLLGVLFVYNGGSRNHQDVTFGEDDAYTIKANPSYFLDYQTAILELGKSNELEVTIPYYKDMDQALWAEMSQDYLDAFSYIHGAYPQYFSAKPDLSLQCETLWNKKHEITLKLYNSKVDDQELLEKETLFRAGLDRHLGVLQSQGLVGGGLSPKDEVGNVFDYVVDQLSYQLDLSDPWTFSGYSATERGTAVCQGYVAMFHGILDKLGYQTLGVTGFVGDSTEPHVWSQVQVDGLLYFFDPTYADGPQAYPGESWAFLSYSQMHQGRTLDIYPST